MFKRLLIANRGEIAVRIIKTARRLGIKTVVPYSDADSHSLSVLSADSAYHLPGNKAAETYLDIDKILAIASEAQVNAIHPGYGFLSENAEFARRCVEAGFVFIGPQAKSIELMGSKSAAKELMLAAKVPVVPGYQGGNQNITTFSKEAEAIGYPVLLKAALGGGGKGMRVVNQASELSEAFAQVQREALASFGDEEILIEKYLQEPRHIEIQVFADSYGECIHLAERDCSIQRRHQKVIEEAPALGLKAATRSAMGEAAIQAAKAIDYRGAGTIEFLLDKNQQFYFMEMNTRLQVEHPVTEMVTGLDLVEWQLRVAAGEKLPSQSEVKINGHAIEARIYAEDPSQDFLPQTGTLFCLQPPQSSAHIRIDSGVTEGDEVSVYYDPMIAKLICWHQDRATAIRCLEQALANYAIMGVKTNITFLQEILQLPAYQQGEITTAFLPQHHEDLFSSEEIDPTLILLTALAKRLQQEKQIDPNSPWQTVDAWQLNTKAEQQVLFQLADKEYSVVIEALTEQQYCLRLAEKTLAVTVIDNTADELLLEYNGSRHRVKAICYQKNWLLCVEQKQYLLQEKAFYQASDNEEEQSGSLRAPMPGTVIAIHVAPGQHVEQGDALLILEAMKMEHTIRAPRPGVVESLCYSVGALVQEGQDLLVLAQE